MIFINGIILLVRLNPDSDQDPHCFNTIKIMLTTEMLQVNIKIRGGANVVHESIQL